MDGVVDVVEPPVVVVEHAVVVVDAFVVVVPAVVVVEPLAVVVEPLAVVVVEPLAVVVEPEVVDVGHGLQAVVVVEAAVVVVEPDAVVVEPLVSLGDGEGDEASTLGCLATGNVIGSPLVVVVLQSAVAATLGVPLNAIACTARTQPPTRTGASRPASRLLRTPRGVTDIRPSRTSTYDGRSSATLPSATYPPPRERTGPSHSYASSGPIPA